MSEKNASVEIGTLDKMIAINYWINECSSSSKSIQSLIMKVRKLTTEMMDKQQLVATNAALREAKKVDLSIERR